MRNRLAELKKGPRASRLLISIKQSSTLSPFIKISSRHVAAFMTRLRLNRARLNDSLYTRRVVASPLCTHDPCFDSGMRETPEHVLISCPAYSAKRDALAAQLRYWLSQDLTIDFLLGEGWPWNMRQSPAFAAIHDLFLFFELSTLFIGEC